MSLLYYFASDTELRECPNPYVKMMSVCEARESGIDFRACNVFVGLDEETAEEFFGEEDLGFAEDMDEEKLEDFFGEEGLDFVEDMDEDELEDFFEEEGLDFAEDMDEEELEDFLGEEDLDFAEDMDEEEWDLFASIDEDKPAMILVCEDEEKMGYPNIFSVDKEEYKEDIGTTKQFCAVLEWNYSLDEVYVIYDYICEHLKRASEIEVWCRWLGEDEEENTRKTKCFLEELTMQRLGGFFEDEYDNRCLVIVSNRS